MPPRYTRRPLLLVSAHSVLAEARSRSGKNNTQLFSNTFAPLRYDKNNTQLFLSLHFLHNERLEGIAFADVVELLDTDTALYCLPRSGEGGPL